jgi:hypothetical protein
LKYFDASVVVVQFLKANFQEVKTVEIERRRDTPDAGVSNSKDVHRRSRILHPRCAFLQRPEYVAKLSREYFKSI